ncbi:MAG: type II toxin-antitoxin system Phd/YefM family antitoxin [Melioribacteraceae bacterium]|jgi:antitoxin YefM|nr:type II toxin-antitoxin system Phd/YefM family antitoxin [Melioribacteraceae bacterium]
MIAVNFTEFRTDLKRFLDEVEDNQETLIIKRKSGKGTVMISIDEYNSLIETAHLMKSKTNSDRIIESIKQINDGDKFSQNLSE